MNKEDVQNYIDIAVEGIMNYAPKVLAAIIILWIGFKLVKRLSKVVGRLIQKSGLSAEISSFASGLVDVLLKGIVILVVAGIVGVDTTSFVALIAAAGFAVGLALQGSLSNFAAGILILVFKPYRVDDYIEVQEKFGKVKEIQIFNTILVSPGNKTHIVPNAKVMEDVVTNLSAKGNIRIELEVNIPYSEDLPKVKQIIQEALDEIPTVLKDPEPEIGIIQNDTHYIILAVRPFSLPDDYWDTRYEVLAGIKQAFNRAGVKMAYSEGVELGEIGA